MYEGKRLFVEQEIPREIINPLIELLENNEKTKSLSDFLTTHLICGKGSKIHICLSESFDAPYYIGKK